MKSDLIVDVSVYKAKIRIGSLAVEYLKKREEKEKKKKDKRKKKEESQGWLQSYGPKQLKE